MQYLPPGAPPPPGPPGLRTPFLCGSQVASGSLNRTGGGTFWVGSAYLNTYYRQARVSISYFPLERWETEAQRGSVIYLRSSSYKYEILHAAAPRMNLFKQPPDPALLLLTCP